MKKLITALGAAAFLLLIGVVGAIEHGAALRVAWLMIPALLTLIGCAGYATRRG